MVRLGKVVDNLETESTKANRDMAMMKDVIDKQREEMSRMRESLNEVQAKSTNMEKMVVEMNRIFNQRGQHSLETEASVAPITCKFLQL